MIDRIPAEYMMDIEDDVEDHLEANLMEEEKICLAFSPLTNIRGIEKAHDSSPENDNRLKNI